MKSEHKIMVLAVAGGLTACIADAFFDYLFFYDNSFLDVLLFDLQPIEVYFRCTLLVLFIVIGLVQVRLVAGREFAEKSLLAGEEKFRALFDAAPVGLGVANMNGTLVAFNDAMLKPGGYSREDMTAISSVAELYFKPEQRLMALEMLSQHGAVHLFEVQFKRKDGTAYDAALSLRPVSIQGEPHMLAVVEDITERKRTATELVRLERLRALGEMSAGVSHNLNNMLSVVLGYATLLQGENKNKAIAGRVDAIVASTVRASDLVRRLHSAVGMEGDQSLVPVDLNEIIRQDVETTRPRWQDEVRLAGIELNVITELAQIPLVSGTVSELSEIVTKLLLNAVDAMPQGGSITIQTSRVGDDRVQLIVKDTGVGMDEATRQRLFEPFFTTKMNVGAGLGLSTIYGTVTRWAGTIDVQSAPGTGAAFTIVLPSWKGPVPQQEEEPPPDQAIARRCNVLIVEDDDQVAEVLMAYLQREHDVYRARDGQEALGEKFAELVFDVAFIDLGLPNSSGDKVAMELRQAHPALATVLITGWDLEADDPRLQAFDHSLQKPFSLDTARQIVAKAVG